jgi:hypothetical protein
VTELFKGWDGYFMLLGTAAAGLIGLLFVVVTLTAGHDRAKVTRGQSLYMTPTMLGFAIVLSVSAMTLAPGIAAPMAAVLLGVAAVAGLTNTGWACVGIWGLRKSEDPPHWTDFWMYGATPTAIYVALAVAGAAFAFTAPWAVHALAVVVLALMLQGVRNAWDLVTWIAPARNSPTG